MKSRPRAFRTEEERTLAAGLDGPEKSPETVLQWVEQIHAETLSKLAPLQGGDKRLSFLFNHMGRGLDGEPIPFGKASTELEFDHIRLLNAAQRLAQLLHSKSRDADLIAYAGLEMGACLAVVQGRSAVEAAIQQGEARVRGGKSRKIPESVRQLRSKRLRLIFEVTGGRSVAARLKRTAAEYCRQFGESLSEATIARDLGLRK